MIYSKYGILYISKATSKNEQLNFPSYFYGAISAFRRFDSFDGLTLFFISLVRAS